MTNSPDSLPPAICRISFVKPGAPNWHDKSWSVRGSFLSISRSKKNSSVKLRTCSYSIDSMLMLIGLQSFSLSFCSIFLCRSLLLAFMFVWASEEEEEEEEDKSQAEDDISPQEAVSRCNYRSQKKWLQLNTSANKLEICANHIWLCRFDVFSSKYFAWIDFFPFHSLDWLISSQTNCICSRCATPYQFADHQARLEPLTSLATMNVYLRILIRFCCVAEFRSRNFLWCRALSLAPEKCCTCTSEKILEILI